MFTVSNIYLASIIFGVVQVLALLFNRRGNLAANRLLALLIGLLVLALWNVVVDFSELSAFWKTIDFNNWITPFFWGPALYLYVTTLTSQTPVEKSNLIAHASIGIAFFVLDIILTLLGSGDGPNQYLDYFNTVRLLAFYLQMAIYLFASLQALKIYASDIKKNYSSIESLNLSWLQRLVAIFAIILCVDMTLVVPSVLRDESIPFFTLLMIVESVAVFTIGYFSLTHSGILFHAEEEQVKPRYSGSPIDSQLSVDLMEKLSSVMEKSKPYLNNELRLSDLADLIGISPYYLSQVINEQSDKNFYDFVNEYRAKHAAEILATDDTANITKVAYESGFNNRVSFNNAFKRHMAMTPSRYRGKHNAVRSGVAK